jgi:hypothetical protein
MPSSWHNYKHSMSRLGNLSRKKELQQLSVNCYQLCDVGDECPGVSVVSHVFLPIRVTVCTCGSMGSIAPGGKS